MKAELEDSRAAKIRLHRRHPELVAEIKARVRASMLADNSAKLIAALANVSASGACRWAHVLGFRRMYVTAEERAHLLERRGGVAALLVASIQHEEAKRA